MVEITNLSQDTTVPTDFFNVTYYEELGLNLPPAYIEKIQDNWDKIIKIINLNTYTNPLFLHIYINSFYHLFASNDCISDTMLPIYVPILGMLASEKIDRQDYWDILTKGTETEQHYKLWRYFLSTYLYRKNWSDIDGLANFLMAFVDYAFYWDNPFQRDVLLFYLFHFMNTGVLYQFDFNEICNIVRDNMDTYFSGFMEALVSFEKLKISFLNAYQSCQKNISSDYMSLDNGQTALSLAAFFKINTSQWFIFQDLICRKEYEKASKLCFSLV